MKKNIFALILILTAVFISYSQPVTDAVVDAAYEFEYYNASSSSAAADTIGGADTTVLYSNLKPERGWEYILVRDAITGTGSDSAYYYLHVRCKDSNGNLLYALNVDTIDGAAGLAEQIPFGGTLLGHKFDIWAIGTAASTGGQVIFNRSLMYRRKPITTVKDWR